MVKNDIEENKLGEVLDPGKLYELPESWNVNNTLVWHFNVDVNINIVLRRRAILDVLCELVLKGLISPSVVIKKELLQVSRLNLVKVVVIVNLSNLATVSAW